MLPLGLALGFYSARVRRVDVAHFDCKSELGATRHGTGALPRRSPDSSKARITFYGSLFSIYTTAPQLDNLILTA